MPERLTIWVRGRVQGVGFRWWTRARALELGLTGWARNLDDGRVEVVAEGERDACLRLLDLVASSDEGGGQRSRPGRVSGVVHRWSEAHGVDGFAER